MDETTKDAGWLLALGAAVTGGQITGARGQVLLTLVGVEAEGRSRALIYERVSGKALRVTAAMLSRCWAATADGRTLERRKNGPTGISYTVAVEAAVVSVLGLVLNDDGEWTRG